MATYRDLQVYQKGYALVLEIYELTREMPKEEQYGLVSQMRRAAVSIPLNIAEGYGKRGGDRETNRFLSMARGSCCEMDVLLSLARDLEYIAADTGQRMLDEYSVVAKMLTRLSQTLTADQ